MRAEGGVDLNFQVVALNILEMLIIFVARFESPSDAVEGLVLTDNQE